MQIRKKEKKKRAVPQVASAAVGAAQLPYHAISRSEIEREPHSAPERKAGGLNERALRAGTEEEIHRDGLAMGK